RELRAGTMSIFDVIQWAADEGCEHIEIVPAGFNIDEPDMPERIREKAAEVGLPISNYAINANFALEDDAEYEKEVERIQRQVDVARRLGSRHMRHDIAWRQGATMLELAGGIDVFAHACRRIADYAHGLGIVTSMENHGL